MESLDNIHALTKLCLAFLAWGLYWILRQDFRPLKKPETAAAAVLPPLVNQQPSIPAAITARPSFPPGFNTYATQAVPTLAFTEPNLRIRPEAGTWYLRALPDEVSEELQKTFETLPFDTAVRVLQNLNDPARRQVLGRLKILPAIRTRLEKYLGIVE